LRKDNCLDAVDDRSANITDEKWKNMDDNVVANLNLAMADSILPSIVEKKTT